MIEKAIELIKQLKDEEAIKLLKKELKKDPANAKAYLLLSFIYNQKKDLDEAADYFEQASKLEPDYQKPASDTGKEMMNFLGIIQKERQQKFQKSEYFQNAQALFQQTLKNIDFKALKKQQIQKTEDLLLKDPNNFHYLIDLAIHYQNEEKNLEKANIYYVKALKIQPQNTLVLGGIAEIYYKQGDLDKSLNYFKKAAQVHQEGYYFNRIAEILLEKNDLDEAAKYYLQVKKYSGYESTAKTFLIVYYFHQGDYNNIIDHYLDWIQNLQEEESTWDAFYCIKNDSPSVHQSVKDFIIQTNKPQNFSENNLEQFFQNALLDIIRGRTVEGLKQLEIILKNNPEHILTLKLYGGVLYLKSTKNYPKVKQLFSVYLSKQEDPFIKNIIEKMGNLSGES